MDACKTKAVPISRNINLHDATVLAKLADKYASCLITEASLKSLRSIFYNFSKQFLVVQSFVEALSYYHSVEVNGDAEVQKLIDEIKAESEALEPSDPKRPRMAE